MSHPDVLVLGGGIIGLACARELALAGHRVEVVERLAAGASASVAAAGLLAPLAEAPMPGPFFEACRASRDLWLSFVPALEEETGLQIEHDTSGSFAIAFDDQDGEEEAGLARLAAAAAELGEDAEEVEVETLRHWLPGISPAVRRALRLPGDHRVDNVQACAVLKAAAVRRGVTVSYAREVLRVDRLDGGVRVSGADWSREAGLLVLAAGAWSGVIPGLPELPVRPVRGQMLLLGGVEWPLKGSVRGAHAYAVRRGVTGLLVGATVEEAGFLQHPTVAGVQSLLAVTRHAFPGLGEARLETVWAGLRPGTADGLPLIGPLPGWPALVATGHYRNGILLAPWTARQIAALAGISNSAALAAISATDTLPANDNPAGLSPDLAAFAPARFLPSA